MIVGVLGQAGSGKDTVADILVRDHDFVKVALADPMKRAVADWFNWSPERLWGPSHTRSEPDPARDGLTARHALQFLGTEVGRELHRDVWVEYALRAAKKLLDGPGWSYIASEGVIPDYLMRAQARYKIGPRYRGVVISDVRFRNEVDAIRAVGGQVWKIVRPGAGLTGAAGEHPSEAEQRSIPDELFHVIVHNGGTLEDLAAEVGRVLGRG